MERLEQWKQLFLDNYHLDGQSRSRLAARRSLSFSSDGEEEDKGRSNTNLSERYFEIGLKLFYRALEKIFVIERKRSNNDQSLQFVSLFPFISHVSSSLLLLLVLVNCCSTMNS